MHQSDERSRYSHNGTKRAQIGKASGYTHRSFHPDAGGGPAITARDEGLARRLKALACTAPLHDLDARKVRLDWCDASVYQMSEIALQVIDQVTVAMDFDRGADHDDVIGQPAMASRIGAIQNPAMSPIEPAPGPSRLPRDGK